MATLTAFFEARQGRLYGFRFRDFSDFKSCAPGAVVTPLDQLLGQGDGARTVFPLVKAYGDAASAYERRIAKPVVGTVRLAISGVETTDFTIDSVTGSVGLEEAPALGAPVTAGFEFDTPVRFDADRVEVTLESFEAGRMAALPLIEVRI